MLKFNACDKLREAAFYRVIGLEKLLALWAA